MSPKSTFATQIKSTSSALAQVAMQSKSIVATYFDRGYNSGGSAVMTDQDIAGQNITAANVAAFITLAQQLDNFLNNAAVTTGDYDSTVNKLRTDL